MEGSDMRIRNMQAEDWSEVRAIYRQGINTGIATFETEVPDWKKWDEAHLAHSRIIAEQDGVVTGWAAISAVSDRCVYGGVAEVSIYVGRAHRGKGVGAELLQELVKESERNGIWTLQAGIFAENEVSIRLHKKCGFRIVGRRERLGRLDGEWKDVMLLEHRSDTTGIE